MDQLLMIAQSAQDALQNMTLKLQDVYQNSGFEQYQFIFNLGNILLFALLPFSLCFVAFLLVRHPLYFIARKNSILKLTWRKIAYFYRFEKTAKVLAENDHYGFKPCMDVILYRSNQQLFSSVEVFSLGTKRYALCIPEKMWNLSQDALYAQLLKPQIELKSRMLMVNTLVFFTTNIIKFWQHKTFNFINMKIKNSELKNFMLISIYIFFLPLVYSRLNLRYYSYYNLMKRLYGDALAQRLAQEQQIELHEFLNKPITYFFGLINENA